MRTGACSRSIGAMDRSAAPARPLRIALFAYPGVQGLDLSGPLELFAACHGEMLRELAHELARFQTALGDLHDCDGWVEECGKYLSGRGGADKETGVDAAGRSARGEAAFWLLEHFTVKRALHYAEALEIWRGWESRWARARC